MAGSWNIDVAQSSAIIKSTGRDIAELRLEVKSLGSALEAAAAAIPGGPVVAALRDLSRERLGPDIEAIATRSEDAISSTVNALIAYQEGDVQMDRNAQAQAGAVDAPVRMPGEPRYY